MASETTLPMVTEPASNGQPSDNQFPKQGETETPILRATRILSGDIRKEDYLIVPDDIVTFVADAEARGGVQMLPKYRQLMISDLALQAHHAGDEVLVRHTADGVIVLAAGFQAINTLWDQLTAEQKTLASFAYPATLI